MNATEPSAGRRLPPGSHGIPADVIARNQRERLIAAMAEECAERGYAEATVERITKRAGVSSVTFYKQFAGKQDCLLAAHRQLPPSARLLTVEVLAAGPEGVKRHDATVEAFAERLGTDWVLASATTQL